jgi:uncharacterized membrane protein YkoI
MRQETPVIRTKLLTFATAGVIAAGTLAGAAFARENDNRTDEAAVIANSKISMAQAITTAERQTGGKAVGTGIEDQDGTVFLEVQVVKNNQRQKVLIDPKSGNVAKVTTEDNEQNENDHESNDD